MPTLSLLTCLPPFPPWGSVLGGFWELQVAAVGWMSFLRGVFVGTGIPQARPVRSLEQQHQPAGLPSQLHPGWVLGTEPPVIPPGKRGSPAQLGASANRYPALLNTRRRVSRSRPQAELRAASRVPPQPRALSAGSWAWLREGFPGTSTLPGPRQPASQETEGEREQWLWLARREVGRDELAPWPILGVGVRGGGRQAPKERLWLYCCLCRRRKGREEVSRRQQWGRMRTPAGMERPLCLCGTQGGGRLQAATLADQPAGSSCQSRWPPQRG